MYYFILKFITSAKVEHITKIFKTGISQPKTAPSALKKRILFQEHRLVVAVKRD